MKNGKRLEIEFRESMKREGVYVYRFRDGTGGFRGQKNENVRFQSRNVCDYLVWYERNLVFLELKSHKGKSLPMSCVRGSQIEGLLEAKRHGIISGLLVEFSDYRRVFYIDIDSYEFYYELHEDKKSVPMSYFEQVGLELVVDKKRVNIKIRGLDFIKRLVERYGGE